MLSQSCSKCTDEIDSSLVRIILTLMTKVVDHDPNSFTSFSDMIKVELETQIVL